MLKSSPQFEKAYAQLNPRQKEVVDTIEGPVMVVAGPGTGKTQVLATRIANILLKTDTSPYAILALTFTESAAKNMRERLVDLIGPTAYSVHVQTFHAFCDDVIRSHPEYFPINPDSEVLSDLERFAVLEDILLNSNLKVLRPINSPFHYIKSVMKAVSDLKREGVSEVRYAELIDGEKVEFEHQRAEMKKTEITKREKELAKMAELAVVYTHYQQELQKRNRYDYDDMIRFVAEAFASEETLLLEYQEKLTYFLVDEYQDTNAAQNTVVDLLASFWGEQANIFVVGDPHQSIYRFQGASLENTLNFASRYPQGKIITLEIGYRCPQIIYDVAAEIIANERAVLPDPALEKALAQTLKSVQPDSEKIHIYAAPSLQLETIFITKKIEQLIAKGVKPNQIAILYKKNADAENFQVTLDKWGIEFNVDTGNDVLKNEVVCQFINLLKVISSLRNSQEGYELFEVLNYPWIGLDRMLVMKIARAASKSSMSMYERVIKGYVEFCTLPFCEDVTAEEFEVVGKFIERLVEWGQRDAQLTFPDFIQLVLNESGFLNWVLGRPEKVFLLQHVNALVREVKTLTLQEHQLHLNRFLEAIATMEAHGISILSDEIAPSENAVTLSTVHKAKGREWEYVFLTGCIDGKWGNSRKIAELPLPSGILVQSRGEVEDRDEDDRRLFYVAITRAKRQLTITYPESVTNGNKAKLTLGSMFIEEIPETHKCADDDQEIKSNSEEYLAKLIITPSPKNYSDRERDWFREVVKDFKLSFTSLNRYLHSPQEFIERDLLRVPEVKAPHQVFGTAVHFALEFLYRQILEKKKVPPVEKVIEKFNECLQSEIISPQELINRTKKGEEVLLQYYQRYQTEFREPVTIEKGFGYGWSKTFLGDIHLTGRVDRMDWVDKAQKKVCVIDYKTGKAKTINQIEGQVSTSEFSERELNLPENIRGPYKRQLLFYKLLSQLDASFPYLVTEGTFDFVQPDDNGKFVQRTFALEDKDVEALTVLIQEVMAEIRSLKFLEVDE
jgi:DNA helicase II / ATP-dependent DNA helicase PcrA